jgi:hypothetical protein
LVLKADRESFSAFVVEGIRPLEALAIFGGDGIAEAIP